MNRITISIYNNHGVYSRPNADRGGGQNWMIIFRASNMYDPFARLFHMDPLQNRKNRFTFYITTKQGRSYIMGHRAMAPRWPNFTCIELLNSYNSLHICWPSRYNQIFWPLPVENPAYAPATKYYSPNICIPRRLRPSHILY